MASPSSCPSEGTVTGFLEGRIAGEALACVEGHLDGCPSCRLLLSAVLTASGADPPSEEPLSAFAAGDLLANRYRVVRLIGVGGMGEVYEAMDELLGETVALKSLAVGTPLDDAGIRRLKAEVQLARRVTHRNVCRVFDVGLHTQALRGGDESMTVPFFTMELLRGETLRAHAAHEGPLPVREVVSLLEQLAAAVDAAHGAGVVHADLKPDNVMLVNEGDGARVVVTDFGLAKQLGGPGLRFRGSGASLAGTVAYLAPERLRGKPASPAADIYALGVMLFELATGRLPFGPEVLASAVANKKEVMLEREAMRGLPPKFASAIARCLANEPGARFARASELVAALDIPKRARESLGRRFATVAAFVGATVGSLALVRAGTERRAAEVRVAGLAGGAAARAVESATAGGASAVLAGIVPAVPAPDRVEPRVSASLSPRVPPELETSTPKQPRTRPRAPLALTAGSAHRAPIPPLPGEDDLVDPFEKRARGVVSRADEIDARAH